MAKKRYAKLVRDTIPTIIRADGAVPNVRVLQDDEYTRELCYKLIEEAEEVRKAADAFKSEVPTELADVLEVVDALIVAFGYRKEDILAVQAARRAERGGFTEKIFLDSVDDPNGTAVV